MIQSYKQPHNLSRKLPVASLLIFLYASLALVGCSSSDEVIQDELTEENIFKQTSADETGARNEAFTVLDSQSTESIAESETPTYIRIATQGNISPFSNTRADGSVYGLDIDLGQALCKNLNFDCEWIILDQQSLFPALNSNKVDLIISAVPVTRYYKDRAYVSEPYLGYQPGLLVPASFPIESYSINDIAVGLIVDTPMQRYVRRYFSNVQLVDYPDMAAALEGLDRQEITGVLHGSLLLNQFVGYDKTLYLLEMDDHFNQLVQGYGVAVRKQRFNLVNKVRLGLAILAEQGLYQQLEEHARRQPKRIKQKEPR